MPIDPEFVKSALPQSVPMVATLNLAFRDLSLDQAVMVLPDQVAFHNHVGGPHAGAMFTLAESASGALILANFGDVLDRVVPLAVSAEIRYLKLALGEVTATATMGSSAETVLAELDSGKRPELLIDVALADASGVATGHMTIRWTLKPLKRAVADG